jgi:hypothetical protein
MSGIVKKVLRKMFLQPLEEKAIWQAALINGPLSNSQFDFAVELVHGHMDSHSGQEMNQHDLDEIGRLARIAC